ncbi:phenylalanine--tRNA ligase subunit beta [Chlamydia sp. 17-3921]|uniref:phenylalanine--tRNA ligase subunit beta n=1 Tax=Chlamydia sp. 17-3921 TaxID=2675798 RepID=UPI00191A22AE|nr:phenylalanine--tRNA ligase subunit beta [Chlamydia sp. 17-3921]
MHVPLSLLQTYFSSPLLTKEILEACDRIGIEAEVCSENSCSFSSVITAKILKTSPHPNADKLQVAVLFDGNQEYQVVCGAPNCRTGIVVPLAIPGAKLTDNEGQVFSIKKSKLRGIESQGMCCGADELGLHEYHTQQRGLLELPEETPLGEDVATLFRKVSLELSLTPNLGHCASLFGLAREISYVTSVSLVLPKAISLAPLKVQAVSSKNDSNICPLFCYAKISGIDPLLPSPQELQDILYSLKQKSINTIVDITNYIMFALGQPLHAYDAKQADIHSLRVQALDSTQSFVLLNNETVTLPETSTVICDDHQILALGGVMGGFNSAVTNSTTEIILEAAYFPPKVIRASQRLLPIHSEAAYRFSRGVDYNNVLPSLFAAIHSILKVFPKAQCSEIYTMGETQSSSKTLELRSSTVQRILGEKISKETLKEKLQSLGFSSLTENPNSIVVKIPSYRHDIVEEIDLVEEISRTQSWHLKSQKQTPICTPVYALKRHLVNFLANSGLQQFFTSDLLNPKTADLYEAEQNVITLQGSKHATVLRPSLLPGLLESSATNLHRQAEGIYAFELGSVYEKISSQYKENQKLGIILAGQSETLSWQVTRLQLSFYTLKSWVEKILENLNISSKIYTLKPSNNPNFHPYQQGQICLHKHVLGILGTVHPRITKKVHIKQPIFFGELSIDILCQLQKKSVKHYTPYPIYPSSFRDVTITVPEDLPADSLRQGFLNSQSKWLERVSIISIYQDKASKKQDKNVSLRLVFQNRERTLSNQEIEEEYDRLVARITQQLQNKGIINT